MSNLQTWIDALRSGDYNQTSEHLMVDWVFDEDDNPIDRTAYCCLGVACSLFDPAWLLDMCENGDTATTDVSPVVAKKLKEDGVILDANSESPTPYSISYILGMKNDQGYSFAQIADALENDPTFDGLQQWFNDHAPDICDD
jgi:hypothetical protein